MSANSVLARPGSAAPAAMRTSIWNAAMVFGSVLAWAILIWRRRWMSEDGLIVLRTVRQIVAGNGPVFNVGERVETNTSALWGWMLVLPDLIPGVSLNWAAVVLGLVLSVTGLAFAMDAACRLWGVDQPIVPAGALVVCALPPFWDFGTSGLETGLIFCWLGVTWWMLVRLTMLHRAGPHIVRVWPIGVAIGLGPLVRPDLALVTLAFGLLLAFVSRRRGLRRLVGVAAVSAILPVGYGIFRIAYYGVLVPAPALAKEATGSRWNKGVLYLVLRNRFAFTSCC
jgi:arabinofuranosyltransferase